MTNPPHYTKKLLFKGPINVDRDNLRTMLCLLVFLLLCVNSEEAVDTSSGPNVQHLKVSVVSPWAIFVSWKKPDTVANSEIKKYVLSGNITETRTAGDDWVFCFVDKNLQPGSEASVTMTVMYNSKGNSTAETVKVNMPSASEYIIIYISSFP